MEVLDLFGAAGPTFDDLKRQRISEMLRGQAMQAEMPPPMVPLPPMPQQPMLGAPAPTPRQPAQAGAGARALPRAMGTPPQPPMAAPGPSAAPDPLDQRGDYLGQQMQEAEAARQAAYAEPDRGPSEAIYKQRAAGGGQNLMLALAAQEAGMQPFQAHFLKQASEAQAPMKMAGGTMTPEGFIADPTYAQNLAIQRADAKVAQIDRALQANITQQERRRLEAERLKAQQDRDRERQQDRMDMARLTAGLKGSGGGGAGDDGLEKASMEGYTPEGKRVVTSRQGIPYVVDIGPDGKPTQTVYNGQIIPKATHEKNTTTATEHLASAEGAADLLRQLEAVDAKNFGWRGKAASMSPDFLKSDVAGALNVDPAARDVQANIMSMAAEKIKEMYGAAQSVGEAERAKTFLPTQGDDLATLKIKLKSAERWGRDHARRTGGAALGAATSRTGMGGAGALTVVRTGKDSSGRRVKQMSDGSIQYGE